MNLQENKKFINQQWDNSIIPALSDYIRIPNKSPAFDPDWQANGHMAQAVKLIVDWCKTNAVESMQLDVVQLANRTPLLFIEIPGSSNETILLYGHLDKQPEMQGWESNLGPWNPVIKGDKLYGRGAADDGYAIFASLTAINALRAQQQPHARCIIIIEASEESGSSDLVHYIDALKERIGQPDLVICLDSGCGNYEQLWLTTSLRGLVNGSLTINVLKEGVHSGSASGIVPACFRILRQLLNRIESATTGEILLSDLFVDIPGIRSHQAEQAVQVLGKTIFDKLPFQKQVQPQSNNLQDLLLNQTWRPALSIIGIEGIPSIAYAGNVTLPSLTVKLSMRLPPTCNAEHAACTLKTTLEQNPPYQAQIRFDIHDAGSGWNAPAEKAWLTTATHEISKNYFGKEAVYLGEGGSIPFMGMLGKRFPQAQFLITGVLGPASNAHGPNEFLHIPTGKKLTCCIAEIIAKHYARR
ncbi:MAG: peptidase M20 [Gammaproteobacteria bacterium RIFCSPHIGHO2_12_FULL_41_20]|nr:MAG: peptidase M20 [Gammaproteobacteria bacterium RIFCSPHIGHO2_12_FULL_41_20]